MTIFDKELKKEILIKAKANMTLLQKDESLLKKVDVILNDPQKCTCIQLLFDKREFNFEEIELNIKKDKKIYQKCLNAKTIDKCKHSPEINFRRIYTETYVNILSKNKDEIDITNSLKEINLSPQNNSKNPNDVNKQLMNKTILDNHTLIDNHILLITKIFIPEGEIQKTIIKMLLAANIERNKTKVGFAIKFDITSLSNFEELLNQFIQELLIELKSYMIMVINNQYSIDGLVNFDLIDNHNYIEIIEKENDFLKKVNPLINIIKTYGWGIYKCGLSEGHQVLSIPFFINKTNYY